LPCTRPVVGLFPTSTHDMGGKMKGFGYLISALAILAYSATASSVEVKKLTCSATHHSVNAAGKDNVTMVGKNIKVTDIGTSFTAVIGKEKIHSTSLIPINKDGETAMVGKDGDTYYSKLEDSYVIQNKGDGYVINNCK